MNKIISSLWQHISIFHKRVYGSLFLIVGYEILKLAPAAVLAIVIDIIIDFDPVAIEQLLLLTGALFIASMLVSLFDIAIEYQSVVGLDFAVSAHLLKKVADKLMRLSLDYHEKHNSSRQVAVLHRGINQFSELIYYSCREIGPTIIQLILTTIVLLWINVIAGITFLIFLPLLIIITDRYGKRIQPLRRQYHELMDDAAGYIGERVTNVRTVQDYATEKRELAGYDSIIGNWLRLGTKRMKHHVTFFLYRDFVLNISRVAIMGIGVLLVFQQKMTPGTLVLFITLTEKANIALFRLTKVYSRVGDSIESIRRMLELFEEKESIIDKPNAIVAPKLQGDIACKNVTFHYEEGGDVLKDISFTLPNRNMLAVIGRSGGGKSTLVKLLYRHYDVQKGSITIDETDIRDYQLQSYRKQIALVPQDIEVFNTSVFKNIAFGAPDASEEDVIKAAKMAYAHDFITSFPSGYQTLVGERGVKLSGGQKQRIGIARALLANPSILVFDEATSSLDTESEQLIQKAMKEISKNYTMIVIAHRLSTVEHADTVMVIDNGAIAEIGSHADLLSKKGLYTKMRELQHLGEIL